MKTLKVRSKSEPQLDCLVSFNNDTHGLKNGRQVAVWYYIKKWSNCVPFVFNKLWDKTYLRFSFDSLPYLPTKYVLFSELIIHATYFGRRDHLRVIHNIYIYIYTQNTWEEINNIMFCEKEIFFSPKETPTAALYYSNLVIYSNKPFVSNLICYC